SAASGDSVGCSVASCMLGSASGAATISVRERARGESPGERRSSHDTRFEGRRYLRPRLTVSLTAVPAGTIRRGAGCWETTRPFRSFEKARLIFPSLQRAFRIARFAVGRGFPLTFGTMHVRLKTAVTWWSAAISTVQAPLPEQPPAQWARAQPFWAEAVSLTGVPKS